MSTFTGNILLEQLGLTDNCEVKRKFAFYSTRENVEVVVKKGFITDLGSIPPCLKSFVRASAIHLWRAYVIHDACYRIGFDKVRSDNILDEALDLLKLGAYARWKVRTGLRFFGSPTDDDGLIMNAHQHVIIKELV